MNEDLIAKLRAVRVLTPQEVIAKPRLRLQKRSDPGKLNYTEWSEFWKKKGLKMASMGDLYREFKELERLCLADSKNVQIALGNVQDRFRYGGTITSTLVRYPKTVAEAQIMPYFTKENEPTLSTTLIQAPFCEREVLKRVLEGPVGLGFFQALFETQDSAQEIIRTVAFGAGTSEDNIYTYVLSDGSKSNQSGYVSFIYYNDDGELIVSASEVMWQTGYSYGVFKYER